MSFLPLYTLFFLGSAALIHAAHTPRADPAWTQGRGNSTIFLGGLAANLTGDDQHYNFVVVGGGTAGIVSFSPPNYIVLTLSLDFSCSSFRRSLGNGSARRSRIIIRAHQCTDFINPIRRHPGYRSECFRRQSCCGLGDCNYSSNRIVRTTFPLCSR